MAVNSRDKRASAASVLPVPINLPVPDGSLGQGDRKHATGMYRGILNTLVALLYRTILKVLDRNHSIKVVDADPIIDVIERDHTLTVQIGEGE